MDISSVENTTNLCVFTLSSALFFVATYIIGTYLEKKWGMDDEH